MTDSHLMPKYAAGKRTCPICGTPLPAHQTWPGARYRFCGAWECVAKVKKLPRGRYIETNEHKCEGAGCSNFLREGLYRKGHADLCCSAECWHRRHQRGSHRMKCDCGCGREFFRLKKSTNLNGLTVFRIWQGGQCPQVCVS